MPERSDEDIASISDWPNRCLVTMNASKTRAIVLSSKKAKVPYHSLIMKGYVIEEVNSTGTSRLDFDF